MYNGAAMFFRDDQSVSLRQKVLSRSCATTIGHSFNAFGVNITEGLNSMSPILWCNDALSNFGAQIDVVNMLAVSGTTVQQMLDSQLDKCIADGNDMVLIETGINDLNSTIGNTTISDLLPKYATAINRLAQSGKKVIHLNSLDPLYHSGSTGALPRASSIPAVNGALLQMCAHFDAKYPQCRVLFSDSYSLAVDKTTPTNDPFTGYVNLTDGIHRTSLGAQSAGVVMANNILANVRLVPYKVPGVNLLSPITGTGGTTTANAGTITGAIGTNWNVTVQTGQAAVTITDLAPDMKRLVMVNGANSNSVVYIQPTNTTALTAAVIPGSTIQAGSGFQATAVRNIARLNMGLQINDTVNWAGGGPSSGEPVIVYPTNDFGGYRKFPPYFFNYQPTKIEFIIAISLGANSSSNGGLLTLDLYNPQFNLLS